MIMIVVPGLVLSALAFVLLGYLLRDLFRRREHLPSLTYGGLAFTQRTLALLWAGVLVVTFIIGLGNGVRIASKTVFVTEPITDHDMELHSSSMVTIPLPFFQYMIMENEVIVGDWPENRQPALQRIVTGQLQIPLIFLLGAVFYWIAVMRWPGGRKVVSPQ